VLALLYTQLLQSRIQGRLHFEVFLHLLSRQRNERNAGMQPADSFEDELFWRQMFSKIFQTLPKSSGIAFVLVNGGAGRQRPRPFAFSLVLKIDLVFGCLLNGRLIARCDDCVYRFFFLY